MNSPSFQKLNPEKIALGLIIFVAAILRFYNLGDMSLSNDELSALSRLRYSSFAEMISKGVYIDFHPAGLQIFLFYWVKIFGDGVFMLRLPFVFCSLVSIWLIYKIGKKWYNELTALMAAAASGFLILIILYSQLARMYCPGIMFSLLTVYFWTDLLFNSEKIIQKRAWWGWTLSMSVALHLHYFSFLFVGLVGLSGLFFVMRKDIRKYLAGGFIAIIFFLPEITIFLVQIKTGDIGGWLGPPSKKFLLEFFYELFNRSVLICVMVSLFFLSGLLFGKSGRSANRWRILSLAWFLASFVIAYLYSVLRHPILMYSTLLFSTPFLLLSVFSFVPEYLLTRRNALVTVLIFSIVLIFDTVVPGKYFSTKHFGVFREIAEDAEGWSKKFGVKNVPLVINVINPEYINYYFKRMNEPPLVVADRVVTPSGFSNLYNILSKSSSPFFAYVWSNSKHPLEVPEIIRHYFPYLIERKNYFNAASYLFGKQAVDSVVNDNLFSSSCDFENHFWNVDSNKISTDQYYSGLRSGKMDTEFGTSLKKKISEIPGSGYRYVSFSAWIFCPAEIGDALMVISFDRNGKPYDYHGVLLSEFQLKPRQWQPVIIAAAFPKEIEPDDVFSAYFWNPSTKLFYVDDLKVEVRKGVDPYERSLR